MDRITGKLIDFHAYINPLNIEKTKFILDCKDFDYPLIVHIENMFLRNNVFSVGEDITATGMLVGYKEDEQGPYIKFSAWEINN